MTKIKSGRAWAPGAAGALALSLTLAACGGSGGGGGSSSDASSFTVMTLNENQTVASVLTTLSKDQCKSEQAAQPLKITKQAQASVDQQEQLLAGQDALPAMFPANTPDLIKKLNDTKRVANLKDGLSGTSAGDAIVPGATGAIDQIYGAQLVLPTELNIEGIWYNKQLLSQHQINVPQSWDELTAAFDKLKAAGVQPISNAGQGGDGWGVSRWVGAYLFRTVGPDAMKDVADGKAKLTDPQYVAAADAIGALGKDGDFGPAPTSVDYATALNTFETGKAGFIYMGSWALSDFNDAGKTKIGTDNVGFMPFPDVSGGKGSSAQTPTNVGTPMVVSAKAFTNADTKKWVECIASNYGDAALAESGQITGLKVSGTADVPALTKTVQDQIAQSQDPVLWF